jgi:predicted molibdopterin-dependent oxidoreductase YjgC
MTKDGRKDLMSELVKLTINDKEYEAPKGSLLIDKLLSEKITIPHFCYHPSLGTGETKNKTFFSSFNK